MISREFAGALALGFALVAGGCREPLPASYSPDGKTLAYVKKDRLVLSSGGRERVIKTDSPSWVVWSPDGSYLAWAIRSGSVTTEGVTRDRPEAEAWVLNVASGQKSRARGVEGPLGWLNGDVVGIEGRRPKPRLAIIDPESGQVRTEVEVEQAPVAMSPSANRRELYICGALHARGWTAFDGLHLASMAGTDGAEPVSLGSRESAFREVAQRLPLREVKLSRWTGKHLEEAVLFSFPNRAGWRNGISITPLSVVASPDLGVIAASVITIRGSPREERELAELMRSHKITLDSDQILPKRVKAEMNRLTSHMKLGEVVYYWRTDGDRRTVAQWDDVKSFHALAVDPAGMHLALCSDKGLRIVPLD